MPKWVAAKQLRQAFQFRICSAPDTWRKDCVPKIARAHTIPKSGSLLKIARKGHVYSFVLSFENLERSGGVIEPQLLGLKHASTFTGFCTKHDDSIFAPIEKKRFTGTREQCFLLAYRAFAREVYTKKGQDSLADLQRAADRGKAPAEQKAIQEFLKLHQLGIQAALRDNDHHKGLYDAVLLKGNFGSVGRYIIELEDPPSVMCSGGFFPEQDFDGNQLQDIANLDLTPRLLTVTSFASGDHGFVVFAWLEDSDETCRQFIDSLDRATDEQGSDALLRLFFEHFENVHLRPEWWEDLTQEQRKALVTRMAASANPDLPRRRNFLADDGLRFPQWNIISRRVEGPE